jgi:hypothetical protein
LPRFGAGASLIEISSRPRSVVHHLAPRTAFLRGAVSARPRGHRPSSSSPWPDRGSGGRGAVPQPVTQKEFCMPGD